MKPRNREINIFNLSMLDVICGALGAFLILMVVMMPYYKKDSISMRQELQQAQTAAAEARQAAETAVTAQRAAEAQAEQFRQQAASAAQQLAKTFLLVHIQWATKKQDVDLHVVDPAGAEFFYKQKRHAGRPGELSVDSIYGPGNEVWSVSNAQPGDYAIFVNLYADHGEVVQPKIIGSVLHRDGKTALPDIQLTGVKQKTLMATVTVDANGQVSVR